MQRTRHSYAHTSARYYLQGIYKKSNRAKKLAGFFSRLFGS